MSNARYLQFANGEVHDNSHRFDHPGATPITKTQYLTIYAERRADYLRTLFKPGTRVATTLAKVSSSGMRRAIKVLAVNESGEIIDVSWAVATVVGRLFDRKNGGVICNGCGMDMGFDLVYAMGRSLWPEGTPEPHSTRNGDPDRDGGYAIKQYWV